ncbi:ribbon-helix-helix protein, CopG family [Burkholderia multivorans]|nr:ribbon-helix-helix protein, CopG family [Burkholderia multivorans]MCO8633952.1 ribbon-helix-helix protein, CopG family [Burkholderia multivorans]MCO8647119.1 ribbon-helix-helix protein, CopG family [Burkholderia multivorans]
MLPPIRCYDDEEALVRERARDCGMSVGQFVLAAALGRRTRTKVETHVLNEPRRLGGFPRRRSAEAP